MKYLLLISILLIQYSGYSQAYSDTTELSIIGFAFGKAATRSKSVKIISDLIRKENYDSLKSFFNSANPSLKYLSIKVGEFEAGRSRMKLNENEKAIIELAKQSDEKIEYREGCTIKKIYTFKELFNNENIDLNKSLRRWIKQMEK